MSGFATPMKNFRYSLEIDGVNSFLIQEVQPPKVEFAVINHGAPVNLPDKKTPGKYKTAELVVKKLRPAFFNDNWAWDWIANCVAGVQPEWSKQGFLKSLGPDGFSTVESWYLGDLWPSAIESSNLNSMGDGENVIETITFQVQFYFPISSPQFAALFAGSAAKAAGAAFVNGISG